LLSGNLKISKTKFLLSDILNEIQKILSWAASEKGLDYQIVTDPDLPAYLNSDQDRLLKCLVNLTASAIKHTPQGSVRLHVEKEIRDGQLFIRFDVIDTGVGIAPEKLNTIFEDSVYRIEMDEKILAQLEHGLTVTTGLPLTQQLCQLLGGTLKVQSQLNEGSTFSMCVLAGVDPDCKPKLGIIDWQQEALQNTSGEMPAAGPLQGGVLLVEDQHSNRTVITLMLEALGVQVETAEDGLTAIQLCEKTVYDLILMDLKMPNMDGYETTRQLRQNGVSTPIVALSATVLNEQEHHRISKIFDDFLTKPVNNQKLGWALEKFLTNLTGSNEMSASLSHEGSQNPSPITAGDDNPQTT
jgi:CheY-like chemotaxis protein